MIMMLSWENILVKNLTSLNAIFSLTKIYYKCPRLPLKTTYEDWNIYMIDILRLCIVSSVNLQMIPGLLKKY